MNYIKKLNIVPQDTTSFFTHFIGFLLALMFLIFTLSKFSSENISTLNIISVSIFALSAMLLYGASSYYHYLNDDNKYKLKARKFDHLMIFFLIAGSYTPFCLVFFPIFEALSFTGFIWLLAALGVCIKLIFFNAPRFVSTIIYILMGWSCIFCFPLFKQYLPLGCFLLIALGGIFYTIGGIIYIIKKPNINKFLNFHDIFHCFILLGTITHALALLLYAL